MLGQCTNYLRSRLEGQEKWERTSNKRDLLELLKIVESLSQKYGEETDYRHVAYRTLLRRVMLFHQGGPSNSKYKQRFKEHIKVLEAYNGGFLFVNSSGATARKIKLLGLDAESADSVENAHTSARGKYLATAFLLSLDRRRYGELILSWKKGYAKQQLNYPKTLTDMYELMVAFDSTRETPVAGGATEVYISGT